MIPTLCPKAIRLQQTHFDKGKTIERDGLQESLMACQTGRPAWRIGKDWEGPGDLKHIGGIRLFSYIS